ncbi:MAG TPA: tRNA uridine-5-carboxymethylaminomethyl(34) synthesis GTPase MnmE, partial [Burkholderiales bacterium]|nr:tRNA uridine-5-carboxymethylaminomethyl(34) synthesis GTPase MnmE [Burkholderiales bacterium]
DQVEALGIGRTWRAIEEADAMVLVVDATKGETDAEHAIEARLPPTQRRIVVMNKIDLIPKPPALVKEQTNRFKVWLSAKTGEGLDYLRRALLESAGWHGSSEGLFLARTRHLEALRLAQSHVRQANEQVERPEFLAEELRLAHEALQSILGEFTADDLLGEIFGRFCIGK